MHYCLITYGTRGDVQPFIPLALGLKAKGHEVTLAASGNFRQLVDSYGVDFYPLYGDVEEMISSPNLRRIINSGNNIAFVRRMLKDMHDIRGPLLDGIYQACKSADVIIAVNTCVLYVAAVAEKLRVKWLLVQLNPPLVPTTEFPMMMTSFPDVSWLNVYSYRIIIAILWQVQKKDIAEFRERLGLPSSKKSIFKQVLDDKVPMIHAFSPQLISKPADWEEHITVSGFLTLPQKTDDKNLQVKLPDGLVEWLQSGEKPLYIGFGSIHFPDEKRLSDAISGILAQSNTRVVYCLGWSQFLDLPSHPNLFIIRQADHGWLMPKCRAAVVHGGIGTIAAVMKAGIPAIVASIFVDQPTWGKIIQRKNLGVHIPWRKLSAESILEAVKQAGQPPIVETVTKMHARLSKEDGVGNAVRIIEEYCGG